MSDKIQYIGLDFESSTGDVLTLAPIQIGLTVGEAEHENFESLIGGWKWDERAYRQGVYDAFDSLRNELG